MTEVKEGAEMGDADEAALRRLEESTRDAHRLQLETLRSILERNAGVGYLRPYLGPFFSSGSEPPPAVDADTFRKLVPISSYEDDYAVLIQSMADGGDTSVLSCDPLVCFFYSSGTSTMKPKMVPYFDSKHGKAVSSVSHQASSAILRRFVPPRTSVDKILWFLYAGSVTETRGGLRAMPASAFPMQNRGPTPSPLFGMCISPPQVLLGSDPHQQTYCHLLCGLRRSGSIDGIRAPYAAGLVRALRLLQSKWEQLCDDIQSGCLSSFVTDPAMRAAVEEFLGGPQPDVAERVRAICREQRWGGVLGRLFPEARYVACVTTGSMEQYYPLLKHFAGETLLLLGGDYFASECTIGINTERDLPPERTRYVIIPIAAYFEFLPFEMGSKASGTETVDITGVEVGRLYEMVATTYRGLYRYRLGDVVKVVGFYNSSPQVQFVTRAPKDGAETFTERELMSAMETLTELLGEGVEVMDYAGFFGSETGPDHATIYMEVNKKWASLEEENRKEMVLLLERCCPILEVCLGSAYKARRASGEVGPLELSLVKDGSFDELQRVALENGAPANQYKPPKILRNRRLVDLLRESIVATV